MKPFLCRIASGITLFINWIISLIGSLFNEGKFVRRSIVLFAMLEIHKAVGTSLPRLDDGNLVTALIAVIGILSTALAFYTVERNRSGKDV